MAAVPYKQFTIRPAPHQLADSLEWQINVYIVRHTGDKTVERNFSAANTFKTEDEAIAHCIDFARQIIDGHAKGMSVSDM